MESRAASLAVTVALDTPTKDVICVGASRTCLDAVVVIEKEEARFALVAKFNCPIP